MIEILENKTTFHLQTKNTSIIFHVLPTKHLVCVYWGEKLYGNQFSFVISEIKRASYLSDTDSIKDFKLEQMPLVYPAFGNPDLRTPAFLFSFEDGSRLSDFRWKEYRCEPYHGKLPNLPTLKDETAQQIVFVLEDQKKKIKIEIIFGIFEQYDAFTQSIIVKNETDQALKIEKLMSGSFSFLENDFDLLTLTGAWGRENHLSQHQIRQGTFVLDSKRGASGHGQNPFVALCDRTTDEEHGRIYSMNLVYSGNFEADIEVDMHQNTRMMIGINSFDFEWILEGKAQFFSPQAVLVYSGQGMDKLSKRYHTLYRDCLIPKRFMEQRRPYVINSWEACYFDFTKEKLLNLAKIASQIGIELFVLDDGWFGQRNNAETSLGDWVPNTEKLGGSLQQLSNEIHEMGLQFGLWVEPEMISKQSQLYQQHPNWIIRTNDYDPQQARHQYVLDLSNPVVQQYVIDVLDNLLKNTQIEYIKWDMNRNMTDLGSSYLPNHRQKELAHRYILGLYHILEVITAKYPNVLFEGCAGGGGRFDPGILAYMPQIWTSDDTDAIARLDIQFGTSLIYPPCAMTCHISESPNHQVHRQTSMATRANVVSMGIGGCELDLTKMKVHELEILKEEITKYKNLQPIVRQGQFTRLKHTSNEVAWMFELKEKIWVTYVQTLVYPNMVPKRLRLRNLNPKAFYRVEGTDQLLSGAFLINVGFSLPKASHDFFSTSWLLTKIEETE